MSQKQIPISYQLAQDLARTTMKHQFHRSNIYSSYYLEVCNP